MATWLMKKGRYGLHVNKALSWGFGWVLVDYITVREGGQKAVHVFVLCGFFFLSSGFNRFNAVFIFFNFYWYSEPPVYGMQEFATVTLVGDSSSQCLD